MNECLDCSADTVSSAVRLPLESTSCTNAQMSLHRRSVLVQRARNARERRRSICVCQGAAAPESSRARDGGPDVVAVRSCCHY